MDLRQIRYFVAVAEERHFRRAAERLHMSQPPLSQQIQALEEELGAPLFTRERKRVELTAAGTAFLRRSRALLEQAAGAATEARQIARGEAGRLVIGFMSSAMLGRLPPLLQKLRRAAPEVRVELVQLPPKQHLDAAASGAIDVGFLAIDTETTPMVIDKVQLHLARGWEEELVAALPMQHPLAGKDILALRELATERFITLPRMPESGHHDQVLRLCEQGAGFRVNIAQEVEQLPAALALIAAGYGVSLMPACVMQDWRGMVAFRPLHERPRIPVTVLWRADNASPVLQRFLQLLQEEQGPAFFSAADTPPPGRRKARVKASA